jgi:hypothetical protein
VLRSSLALHFNRRTLRQQETVMNKRTARAIAALDKPATSSKQVNDALANAGKDERLVRGNGYWYFVEGNASGWFSSSVPVYRISDMTLRRWLDYRDMLANDSRNF